jgi:hypothetical protein
MSSVKIVEWRALRKGSLLGFSKVQFPSGLIISDVTILDSGKGPWAAPPSKPMIGKDGAALKDDKGKVRYSPIIEFRDKDTRDRWSASVVDAMRDACPEAFEQ